MKKVLSIVLTMSMSLALTPSVLADEIFNSENAVQPSQVVYDVLNDEGTYENQEILSLDINGTLPEYITDVTYWIWGITSGYQKSRLHFCKRLLNHMNSLLIALFQQFLLSAFQCGNIVLFTSG